MFVMASTLSALAENSHQLFSLRTSLREISCSDDLCHISAGMTDDLGYRLGCDVGGTFTDFVLLDQASGRFDVHKVLTTPVDPSEGIDAGLAGLHG